MVTPAGRGGAKAEGADCRRFVRAYGRRRASLCQGSKGGPCWRIRLLPPEGGSGQGRQAQKGKDGTALHRL